MAGFAPMGIPLGNIGPTTGADFSPYFEMMRQRQLAEQAEADRVAQARRQAEAQRFEQEQALADRAFRGGLESRQLGWQKSQFGAEMTERERQRGFEREQLQTELAARGAGPQGKQQPYDVAAWVEEGMPGLRELTTVGNPAEMSARLKEMKAARTGAEDATAFGAWLKPYWADVITGNTADAARQVLGHARAWDDMARVFEVAEGLTPEEAKARVQEFLPVWRKSQQYKKLPEGAATPEEETLRKEFEAANAYMHNVLKVLNLSDNDRGLVWPYLREIATTGDPALVIGQLRDELDELRSQQPTPALMTGASDEDRAKNVAAYQKAVADQKQAVAEKRKAVRLLERAVSSIFAAHKRSRKKD